MKNYLQKTLLIAVSLFIAIAVSAQNTTTDVAQTISKDATTTETHLGDKGSDIFELGITYYIPDYNADKAYALGFDFQGGKYLFKNFYLKGGIGILHAYCTYSKDFYSQNTSLRIPITLGYTLPFGKKAGLSLYTGPHLNLIVGGKTEYYGETTRLKDIEDVKRFGADWTVGATLNLWGFGLSVEYMAMLGDNANFANSLGVGLKIGF